MATTNSFFKRHSVTVNAATNIFLILLCVTSYVVLLVLYFTQGMGVESFQHVGKGNLAPTTVIPLFGVLLTGATSASLTRCVEHNLWSNLFRGNPGSRFYDGLAQDEPYQRAQWTISPFSRLLYVFSGRSWLLRVSGVLLFGTALLNPILLYGVSPGSTTNSDVKSIDRSAPKFQGFTSNRNRLSTLQKDSKQRILDRPQRQANSSVIEAMILAALVATNNLSVPATSHCTDASCSIKAYAAALQAECVTSQTWGYPDQSVVKTCSAFGKQLCVDLAKAYDAYNFTSGAAADCTSVPGGVDKPSSLDCPGDFTVIFGAWPNYYGEFENDSYTRNTVDCRVRYGTSTISQTGNSTPHIQHDSFTMSTSSLLAEDEAANFWQGSYHTPQSPFIFASVGDSDVVISEMEAYLIQAGPDDSGSAPFTNDTNRVARALERSFDAATLLAFVRAPDASSLTITKFTETAIWTYDTKVLAILAAPLIATLLILSRYWKVQSDYIVIGYDPLKIARRAKEILAPTIPSDQEYDISGSPSRIYTPLPAVD
jgi:hypothetical protein